MTIQTCSACNLSVTPDAAFCPHCGVRAGGPRRAAAMRSERKFVTMLFADVKGSLELIAGLDPEQADDILAAAVERMREAVLQFGGTISQVMGDGVMALFGAPLATEDHALQACLAALAMRSAVRSRIDPPIQVRVGLNSGEVLVRAIVDDQAPRIGAIGEPVHLAARMEQQAEPDQIVMTGETRRLVQAAIECRSLGLVTIRGLNVDIETFELLRIRPSRQRRTGPRLPFVGRAADLAMLAKARDQASGGRGQVVRIVGDAGAGKSRLLSEFLATLPADWLVCSAEALPHRRTSYGAVARLLTSVFELDAADPPEVRRAKVQAALGALPGGREHAMDQPLLSVLDLGVDDAAWHALQPWERRERITQSVCDTFVRVSRGARPMALIVEDAHWLDAESAGLMERIAAQSAGERLLQIVTERAEQSVRWARSDLWTVCRVQALDEPTARGLLQLHMAPGPGVRDLEHRLIAHTRGNPLFLEECLYALVESGEMEHDEDGRFRLRAPVQALRVPSSLRGLLDARVDSLPSAEKDLLQAAAVIGTDVPRGLLRQVADLSDDALGPMIDRLGQDGFLVANPADADRFSFRHGLTREAVHSSILVRTRQQMHARAFIALEGRAEADALAEHAFQAELWRKAIDYARQVGARAEARDANGEAARVFAQALTAAQRLPDSPDRDDLELALHLAARRSVFRLGDVAGLGVHTKAAIALARRRADPVRLAAALAFRSHALWLAGDSPGALAAADCLLGLAATEQDADMAVRARFQQGLVHLTQSRTAQAGAAMREVVARIRHGPARFELDDRLAVTALAYVARAAAEAGDAAAARDAADAARRGATRLDKLEESLLADTAEGYVRLMAGEADRAVAPLERAVETCLVADARLYGPVPTGFLALARVRAGDAVAGAAIAQQAVDQGAAMGFFAAQPLRLAILAHARLATGDLEAGLARAEEARSLAVRQEEFGAEAFALCQLGQAAAMQGQAEEARMFIKTALQQATAFGLRPLAAECAARLDA